MNSVPLPSGVTLGAFTAEKLMDLWKKVRDYDRLFSDEARWDVIAFCERITGDDVLVLETEGGLMLLSSIKPGLYAQVHVIFWDGKLSPKIDLIRASLVWAFLAFDLVRVEALIPEFARSVRRFLEEKLKFQREGRLRNRMWYKGVLTDLLMYSILREEVLDG